MRRHETVTLVDSQGHEMRGSPEGLLLFTAGSGFEIPAIVSALIHLDNVIFGIDDVDSRLHTAA